jgi:hypothetical protein
MAGVKADPRVNDLLAVVRDVIDPLGVDYAIGGAMAMAAHGYARFTEDVDVFITEEGRHKVLRALRSAGYEVGEATRPFHYFMMLPEHGGDPDVRIDLMFPAGEPDLSAAEFPMRLPIVKGGDKFNIVEPNLLAMMKFMSDRDDDEYDLKQLYSRGIFDPDVLRKMIVSIDSEDGEEAARWDALLAKFRERRTRSSKPTGRRIRRS